MAKKRVIEEEPPPASSSDEGEEEEEGEDVEPDRYDAVEDDDEEEERGSPVSKSTAAFSTPTKSSESADSDSTQPSPSPSAFTIKPISPKGSPVPVSIKRRRASIDGDGEDDEATKSGNSNLNSKGCIQRLWSEEDEIEVLKGMARFRSERGADMNEFHEFIKGSLSVDVSRNQVMDKIRRLKKKYLNNCAKGENGNDPVLSNPHDVLSFELSKKVWGGGAGGGDGGNASKRSAKQSGGNVTERKGSGVGGVTLGLASGGVEVFGASKEKQRKKKQEMVLSGVETSRNVDEEEENAAEEEGLWEKEFPCLSEGLEMEGLTEGVKGTVKERIRKMGKVKGRIRDLERKWKKLKKAELELFVQRTELVQEQVKLVLDIIKSE